MTLMIQGCPKPLSRKKLRQLMWRNHAGHTANGMAGIYGRAPGYGKFKRRLELERDRVEKLLEKEQDKNKEGALRASIKRITHLLPPVQPKKERLRVNRARSNG